MKTALIIIGCVIVAAAFICVGTGIVLKTIEKEFRKAFPNTAVYDEEEF